MIQIFDHPASIVGELGNIEVKVYKNSSEDLWVIESQDEGEIVGYADVVHLKNVNYKNGVCGILSVFGEVSSKVNTYNILPNEHNRFIDEKTGVYFLSSNAAILTLSGKIIAW